MAVNGGDVFNAVAAVPTDTLQKQFGFGKYKNEVIDITQPIQNFIPEGDSDNEGDDDDNGGSNNNTNTVSPSMKTNNMDYDEQDDENYGLGGMSSSIVERMSIGCTIEDNNGKLTGETLGKFDKGLEGNELKESPTYGFDNFEKQGVLNTLKIPEGQRKGLFASVEAVKTLSYISGSNLVKLGFDINTIKLNNKKNIEKCIITKDNKPAIKDDDEYFLIARCGKRAYNVSKGLKYIPLPKRIKAKLDRSFETLIGGYSRASDFTEDGKYLRHGLIFSYKHNILAKGGEKNFSWYVPVKESDAILTKMREKAIALGRENTTASRAGKLKYYYFVAYEVEGDNESGYKKKGKLPIKKWDKAQHKGGIAMSEKKGGVGGFGLLNKLNDDNVTGFEWPTYSAATGRWPLREPKFWIEKVAVTVDDDDNGKEVFDKAFADVQIK